MSEFYIYNSARERIGVLQNEISVQWLEHYQAPGEVKITALATDENIALLADGNRVYNTSSDTAARICSVEISEIGHEKNLVVRAKITSELLGDRVVTETEYVANVEAGMYTLYSKNRRGLPIGISSLSGYTEATEIEITWDSVLEAEIRLAQISGLGFKAVFDPETGGETFAVYKGANRSDPGSDEYVGYFGADVGNLRDVSVVRGTTDYKNVAIVAGSGEGVERVVRVVVLGDATGENRRELFVDARDLQPILHLSAEEYIDHLNGKKDTLLVELGEINVRIREIDEQISDVMAAIEYNTRALVNAQAELEKAQQAGNAELVAAYRAWIEALNVDRKVLLNERYALEAVLGNAEAVRDRVSGEISAINEEINEQIEHGRGGDIDMPADQYNTLLDNRGLEKLAEHLKELTIVCDIAQTNILYGVDYFLGDRMPVRLREYGINATARVSSVTMISEKESNTTGIKIIAMLSDFELED